MNLKRCAAAALAAMGALVLPAASPASVSVGHSGWFWGNPLPQGNTLRALDFKGGTGYAAGDFGTLLRSSDGGATWTGVQTGITSDLDSIDVISPTSVVIAGGCSARRSDDGGTTFRRLPFTPSELSCPEGVQSMSFPSTNVGYLLLRDGTLLSTTDGGDSFSRMTAIPNSRAKGGAETGADIVFSTTTNGVAVTSAAVYRTMDGGNTWTRVQGVNALLHSVWFASPSTGYAVGDGGLLLATTNGGVTWSQRPLAGASPANFTSIRCVALTCLLATDNGSHLVRTTDGGITASEISPSTLPVFAAAFASPTRAVAAGRDGVTVLSDDAGVTFSPVPASGGRIVGPFSRLRATSASVAFATGRTGSLARTADGGQTWTDLDVPTTGNVLDVSFPHPKDGYALDSNATLFKTTDGGGNWSLLNTGMLSQPGSVLALDADHVFVIGPRGLRRSGNGGNSFGPAHGPIARAPLQQGDVARGAVFVYGPHDLFVSMNRGASWRAIKRPTRKALRRVDFITSRVGFALDAQGKMWSTSNRGHHWTQLVANGVCDRRHRIEHR